MKLMPLEMQVVSLELAKQMKDLWFEQNSYFSWVCKKGRPFRDEKDEYYLLESSRTYNFKKEGNCWSAYTVAELGTMLPVYCSCTKETSGNIWQCSYHISDEDSHFITENMEADARAKMLIYLKKEGLI